MIIIAKMDAEMPQRKPISIKTISTILSTSIPIIVAASGFTAIALKARPTFVRLNRNERAATIKMVKSNLPTVE